jgi:hemolysin activation/secretion protein
MTCAAKTVQFYLTSIAALLAILYVGTPVKAQTPPSSEPPTGTDYTFAEDGQVTEQAHLADYSIVPEAFSSAISMVSARSHSITDRLPVEQVEDSSTTQSLDALRFTNAPNAPETEIGIKEPSIGTHSEPLSTAATDLAQAPINLPPGVDLPDDVDLPDEGEITPREPSAPDIFDPSPSTPPQPPTPQPLPPPAELLNPSTPGSTDSEVPSGTVQQTIQVERFEFTGNTAFSDEQLAEVTKEFTGRPITFAELLSARTAVTTLYTKEGYVTSGAFIPPQTLTTGTITIQIVEGGLEAIEVNGLRRLNRGYVRSRLALATDTPLNVPKLLEALRLLQLDPLIENLSAELSTGSGPGTSLLIVEVSEANSFSYQLTANNGRSPSVGSFRRGVSLTEGNLFGLGDALTVGYTNTDGSDGIDINYTLPINPRNGTLSLSYGNTASDVIEEPFNVLDIQSSSRYFDITLRQPIIQTATEEFALGLTGSRRESDTSLLEIPFPLSPGADDEGRTRLSALRFFQEWTKRSGREVIALRSQFSLGLGAFDATVNERISDTGEAVPDSRFFSWRGQAQWVRLLAPDTLLLVRGDIQMANQELLPIEQFGLGGLGSVRGYRQDLLLTDSGAFASAEVRLPILRIPDWQGVLQVAPFIDVGRSWNSGNSEAQPDPSTLAAVGLGLQWQQGDRFIVRLDWGIPLVSVDSSDRTLQERGLYFSVTINPF